MVADVAETVNDIVPALMPCVITPSDQTHLLYPFGFRGVTRMT